MSVLLLLSDDLIDSSRVAGHARAAGLTAVSARTPAALIDAARREPPSLVILDLHNPGLDVPALLDGLRAVCEAVPPVVAYGSHVDAARLRAARQAGCDRVLPRSAFVEGLAEIGGWVGERPA
jgi:CheY-like chemotaxis protein